MAALSSLGSMVPLPSEIVLKIRINDYDKLLLVKNNKNSKRINEYAQGKDFMKNSLRWSIWIVETIDVGCMKWMMLCADYKVWLLTSIKKIKSFPDFFNFFLGETRALYDLCTPLCWTVGHSRKSTLELWRETWQTLQHKPNPSLFMFLTAVEPVHNLFH